MWSCASSPSFTARDYFRNTGMGSTSFSQSLRRHRHNADQVSYRET